MDFQELEDKIHHARQLSHDFLPKIPVADFPDLIKNYEHSKTSYLTFIGENDVYTAFTYEEFCAKVYAVARFLQKHGLTRGDRIAVISHNHWQSVIQYFAAWLLGLAVVPINPEADDKNLNYILEKGKVELVFTRSDYYKRIEKTLEKNEALKNIEVVLCEDSIAHFSLDEGELDLEEKLLAESEALILFEESDDGAPKGAVLSQLNLLEEARSIKQWHKIDEQTRLMCVLPIHRINGIVLTLITPFFAGGATVLNQDFWVSRFFPVIKEEEVQIVSLMPELLQELDNFYAHKDKPQASSLRHFICGGLLSAELIETFERHLNVAVICGYGCTETSCFSCFIPLDLDDTERKKWLTNYDVPSVGVDISVNEVEIHDEDGNALGENKRGEIVVRGVNVMLGYDNNEEADEKAFKHGWLCTGDEGFYVRGEINRKFFFVTSRRE